jgi:hypothetical protein
VLRSLRKKGRIRYESRPGSTQHAYDFELIWSPSDQSEHSPSRNGPTSPTTEDDEPGFTTALAEPATAELSEQVKPDSAEASPSRRAPSPSSDAGESPLADRVSGSAQPEPVRAPRDGREKAKPLNEGARGDTESRFANDKTLDGEGTTAPESENGGSYFEEEARLAQARQAVAAAVGTKIPEGERDVLAGFVEKFDARFGDDDGDPAAGDPA